MSIKFVIGNDWSSLHRPGIPEPGRSDPFVHPLAGLSNPGSQGHFENALVGRRVRHGRVLPSPGQVP